MKICSFCRRCCDDAAYTCTEDGHPLLSETIDGSPEMIGGYRLDFLLDSGVKGDTYRAHQTAFGRLCRITVSRTSDATPFLSEAKLAASLFHPNLADVYEAGTLKTGECFVVSEDPEDETLRHRLQDRGPLALLDTIEIIRQAAEALYALHQSSLVHRALRPENIILGSGDRTARIQNIDFAGVAERSIISNKFLIDSAIDSIRYFAPEQCAGEPVSEKTDIYSLGIILYEMLAGSPPFDAATAAGVIDKHRNHRPPDVRIDDFELRMLVTHTLMESLHKRPDKRQSSANAFARQLRHIEQLATHVSTPPPAVTVKMPRKITEHVDKVIASTPPSVTPQERIEPPKPAIDAQPLPIVEERKPVGSVYLEPESQPPRMTEVHAVETVQPVPIHETAEPAVPSAVENFGMAVANFVKEKSAPAITHFSRLKQRRKKLHTSQAPSTPEIESMPDTKKVGRPTLVSREAAAMELKRELAVVGERRARKSKKVEWSQPDDDIPTLADVRSLMAPDEILEPPIALETREIAAREAIVETPDVPQVQPTAVELKEPEQPIEIREVPEVEAILASQIETAEPEPESEPVRIKAPEPVKIEATKPTPVAAIPVAETPKPIDQKPVAKARPQAPALEAQPSPIVVVQPEKPTAPPANVEAPAKTPAPGDPTSGAVFTVKPRGIRISGVQSGKPKAPVNIDDLEEITLVSPARSRFRVDVNKPQPVRKPARRVVPIPSTDSVFYPTLLGGAVKPAAIEPAADSILATYYPASAPPALPYRSIAAGMGFVLLIAFFLFANDSVWKLVSIPTTGDSVSAKSAVSAEPVRPLKSTIPAPASKTLPAKSVERPRPKADDADTSPRSAARTEPSSPERTTPARTIPKPAKPERIADPKPALKPDPIRRQAAAPTPIPVRSNGATRPRIVKVD